MRKRTYPTEINLEIKANGDKYYVYDICDPNDVVFYVGKGKKRRIFSHEFGAFKKLEVNSPLYNKIRKIIRGNQKLKYSLIRFYEKESDALDLEKRLITFYGKKCDGTGSLLNLTDGGDGASGYIFTQQQIENNRQARLNYYHNNPNHGTEHRKKVLQWREEHPEDVAIMEEKRATTLRRNEIRTKTSKSVKEWILKNPELCVENCQKGYENGIGKYRNDPDWEKKRIDSVNGSADKTSATLKGYYADNPGIKNDISNRFKNWRKNNPDAVEARQIKFNETVKSPKHKQKLEYNCNLRREIIIRCEEFIKGHNLLEKLPKKSKGLAFWIAYEKELNNGK